MPIREGKAKLWFNTKEEQDEFDDKMIASVQLQSMNYDDDNFSPVFFRKRQEFFLELSDSVKSEARRYKVNNVSEYVDKYFAGKRDHTFWREWSVHKIGWGYVGSYLLLRELPIRNFYARAWIMFAYISSVLNTAPFSIGKGIRVEEDHWNDKAIKNYGVYKDIVYQTIPTLDGRLPEEKLWKNNQPGFLRPTLSKANATAVSIPWAYPKKREVAWDGTWNMPLEGLASPKHKDGKSYDFIYE